MNCQQYSEILNVFLDGEMERLPRAATNHQQSCTSCQALSRDLLALRNLATHLDGAELSNEGKKAITSRVSQRLRSKNGKRALLYPKSIGEIFAELRWRPLLATVAAGAIVILSYLQFRGDEAGQQPVLQADQEIQLILEEHALQMETGLFQTNVLPSRVVATVASSRK